MRSLWDTIQCIILCNKSSMGTWDCVILSQENAKQYFFSLIGWKSVFTVVCCALSTESLTAINQNQMIFAEAAKDQHLMKYKRKVIQLQLYVA